MLETQVTQSSPYRYDDDLQTKHSLHSYIFRINICTKWYACEEQNIFHHNHIYLRNSYLWCWLSVSCCHVKNSSLQTGSLRLTPYVLYCLIKLKYRLAFLSLRNPERTQLHVAILKYFLVADKKLIILHYPHDGRWCLVAQGARASMMTSWNGNIFRVTGPLCREFTSHR